MSNPPILTREYVETLLDYDPDTGDLIWVTGKRQGLKAGCIHPRSGYIQLMMKYPDGKRRGVNAHRLAWLLYHGELPEIIDHKNGIPADNRIQNLRNTDVAGNSRNRKVSKNNKTGINGISWDDKRQRYHLSFSSPSLPKDRRLQFTFSIKSYGNKDIALEKAIQQRQRMEATLGYFSREVTHV